MVFSKKFDSGLDGLRGLAHRLGMQNNGEINELKVWIAEELGKLRNEFGKLRNELREDLNALEAKMEAKMDAGFRQVNNRIDENQIKTNERLTRIEVNIVSLMD